MNQAPVKLYPYQEAWVKDRARYKIRLKSRQIGASFDSSLEAVLDCLANRTTWLFLSRGERQSRELMEKAGMHAKAAGSAIKEIEGRYKQDKNDIKLLEHKYPNGSKIIGLPSNPDTARGFSANILLDEFAFHKDSRKIWTALYPSVTRGYKVRVLSTPNGKNNKFYELWSGDNQYSKHKTDIYEAVAQGLPANIEELRENCDSDDAWQQEYCCQFLDEATAYITYDLITSCESDKISTALPDNLGGLGELYGGMDVGRKRDLTVIWLVEKLGDVFYTRLIKCMEKTPFRTQQDYLELLFSSLPTLRRFCIDSTGLGMQLAEEMQTKYLSRVEPVTFTSAVKEDMAVTLRRRFEDTQVRIPIDRVIREDIHSIKKYTTSAGNIRFDAERSEGSHADRFWALALALHAGSTSGPPAYVGSLDAERDWYRSDRGRQRQGMRI